MKRNIAAICMDMPALMRNPRSGAAHGRPEVARRARASPGQARSIAHRCGGL